MPEAEGAVLPATAAVGSPGRSSACSTSAPREGPSAGRGALERTLVSAANAVRAVQAHPPAARNALGRRSRRRAPAAGPCSGPTPRRGCEQSRAASQGGTRRRWRGCTSCNWWTPRRELLQLAASTARSLRLALQRVRNAADMAASRHSCSAATSSRRPRHALATSRPGARGPRRGAPARQVR